MVKPGDIFTLNPNSWIVYPENGVFVLFENKKGEYCFYDINANKTINFTLTKHDDISSWFIKA